MKILWRKLVLEAIKEADWANKMVLNPAIIEYGDDILMLFRATGSSSEKKLENKPLPYPIFLGFGISHNGGVDFEFDISKPALSPTLEYENNKITIRNISGEQVINYANGCVEDPRLFQIEGKTYMTTACRMFPPGPYWEHDQPTQCAPDWHNTENHPYGRAASENVTVNVLFEVDLASLKNKDYENAFQYITNLTDPKYGEDRDVFFFPEKIMRNGKEKYALLTRPVNPSEYSGFSETKPSIVINYGDSFFDFANDNVEREILAIPLFDWEKERIGASTPPIKISDGVWLLNYHGKKDAELGYTQSFIILKETPKGLIVSNRCPERLIYATEDFEQPCNFKTPCVFSTGLIKRGDNLLMSYGAADERIGIMEIDLESLIETVLKYDENGVLL